MFNISNKLYTPEWFKIIKPYGLINRIITCFKFLFPVVSRVTVNTFSRRFQLQRKGYDILNIKDTSILNTTNLEVAVSRPYNDYPYRVTSISDEYSIIGCGYTDNIAVQNKDYIIVDGIYWFKNDPTLYCYTYYEDDIPVHYTVAFCASHSSVIAPYKSLVVTGNKPITSSAYDNLVAHKLNGSDNSCILPMFNVHTTNGLQGKVKRVWTEKDYTFAITDTGNLITVHHNTSADINNDIVTVDTSIRNYFVINIDNISYPVSIGNNLLKSYPAGLLELYPTLKVTDNAFSGTDLFDILKNQGCSFTEIPYINNYDVDNTLLNQSMHQGIKLMYLGTVHASNTFACASEAKESLPVQFSDTSFSTIKIDIKYIY